MYNDTDLDDLSWSDCADRADAASQMLAWWAMEAVDRALSW